VSAPSILGGEDLVKHFKVSSRLSGGQTLTAIDRVSLRLEAGETLGVAGESGCGKSTLAKILAGLLPPDSGSVQYRGEALGSLSLEQYARFRRTTQMIFQDPYSSLNPRMRIGDIIAEPLLISGASAPRQREQRDTLMTTVGLDPTMANRFPDEFSGGQRQRIGIARALAASPEIIIADEPVSSLDISIQATIINLLLQMKQDFNLSMMIISHNLMVLRHLCDRIIVMYLGVAVESAPTAALFLRCRHPYTEALIGAIPGMNSSSHAKQLLTGDLPSPLSAPTGCRFHPRCPHAAEICRRSSPPLVERSEGHAVACHLSKQLYGD